MFFLAVRRQIKAGLVYAAAEGPKSCHNLPNERRKHNKDGFIPSSTKNAAV